MTISGFREDFVACVVLMLEFNRAEHNTVRLTEVSVGMTPVEEDAQNSKNIHLSTPNIVTVDTQNATFLQ